MPLSVVIRMASGHIIEAQVQSAATVLDLKFAIKQALGLPLVSHSIANGSEMLQDDQSLRDYARIPEWYVLEAWYSWMRLEVQVTLICNQMECQTCGKLQLRMRKCSRCGARYCCEECQRQDWGTHKSTCRES